MSRRVHLLRPDEEIRRQKNGFITVTRHVSSTQNLQISESRVLTAGRYRVPNHVHRVSRGHTIRKQGNAYQIVDLMNKDKQVVKVKPESDFGLAPSSNEGWITFAEWKNATGAAVTQFSTTWTVPQVPVEWAGQTIFLFNAMEDQQKVAILQPVLQWGPSAAGGGDYWTITSWYIDTNGHAYFSDYIEPVQPGDNLIGLMSLTVQPNGQLYYQAEFQNRPGTELLIVSPDELVWLTETLECYNISDCNNYPDGGATSMTGINVVTGAGHPAVTWNFETLVTGCGQNSAITAGGITLSY